MTRDWGTASEKRGDVDLMQGIHEHPLHSRCDRRAPQRGILACVRVGPPAETAAARRLREHVPVLVGHSAHHARSRVVEELRAAGVGAPEDEPCHALGMARGVGDRRCAGVHAADERELVHPRRVGDRLEIAHERLERVGVDLAR